jgi:flagellar biosynthetic protein FlhB
MAEDKPEDFQKTEEPTQKRLDDARKKGQVATSREVNTWLILAAGGIMIAFLMPSSLASLRDVMAFTLTESFRIPSDAVSIGAHFWSVIKVAFAALSAPFIILFVAALLTGIVQNGIIFSIEPVKPKLSKISPLAGLKRMFSFKNLFEFFKGIFKIFLIIIVAFFVAVPFFQDVGALPFLTPLKLLKVVSDFTLYLLASSLAILFVLAMLDLIYQRMNNIKELRMTKQEVKDEFKNTEGDPHIKAKLRQIRHERARQRMMQAMPKADVVITNPTHYSVALSYQQDSMNAPVMIAKGVDELAFRIRERAQELKIPLYENAPLARALYAGVDIDDEIPPEHYKAVAAIIGYLWQKNRQQGGQPVQVDGLPPGLKNPDVSMT